MANTTWNPSDTSGSVTLTNGNLTATTSAANRGVRGSHEFHNGKLYVEFTSSNWATMSGFAGIQNLTGGLTALFTSSIGCAGIKSNGGIWCDTIANFSLFPSLANGNTVGIAYDLTAGLFWARICPSGVWNGGGGAAPGGTGGNDLSVIGGVGTTALLYPVFSANTSGGTVTANFGDTAFVGAVPSGYTAGWPTSTPLARTLLTQFNWAVDRNDFGGWAGMQFQPNVNIPVTTIGLRMAAGNTGTRGVYLINNATAALLASATIDLTGKTAGQFYYASVSPVTLNAGTVYDLMAQAISGVYFAEECGVNASQNYSVTANTVSSVFLGGSGIGAPPSTPNTHATFSSYYGTDINGALGVVAGPATQARVMVMA